jgi:hypothetical protein
MSFLSRIRQMLFHPETTQGSQRTITAAAGSSASLVISSSMTEELRNELKDFVFYCVNSAEASNIGKWRRASHYYYDSTKGFAFFDADAWPAVIGDGDTFLAFLMPRHDKAELTPTNEFASKADFQNHSFEKHPDDFMRTLYDAAMSGQLGGMGFPSAYDTVDGAGTTTTFDVNYPARYKKKMIIGVGSDTDSLEYTEIQSISGSTLTVSPAITGPSGGELVISWAQPGEMGWLMAQAIGEAFQSGHATQVDDGSATSSVFDVISGHGAQFEEEGIIEVDIGGTYEISQISSISTDEITVDPPFSAAPSNGAHVRNAWSMRQNVDGHKSFGVRAYFHKIMQQIHGCMIGDMSIEGIEGSELPKIDFPMVSMGDEDTPTDTTIPTDLNTRKFTHSPPRKVSAKVLIDPSTAGDSSYECRSWSFKIGNAASRREAVTGTDGVGGVDVTNQEPSLEMSLNTLTIANWNPRTALQADTLQRCVFILGITGGRKLVLWFNEGQFKDLAPNQENDERDYYDITVQPKRDGDATKHGLVVAVL